VAEYKTARYTIERPLHLGAALAGFPDGPIPAAFSAYGLPLGAAFQLRDDILGVFGDPELTGKPAGDDLREGKRTFLVAGAFAGADAAAAGALRAGLGDPHLDDEGVGRLRQIMVDTGALARTERRIAELTESALAALAAQNLAAPADAALVALARAATSRSG
jgi:geranylgeranyl diphosphate synthase type I